jgi:serine/threonine protein kinase
VTEQIADYEVLDDLTSNGDEALLLVRSPSRLGLDGRTVALKITIGLDDVSALERAGEELRVLAAARGPQLTTIYDAGLVDGTFFYSMEYPELGCLARPSRVLAPVERLRAVADAARGAHTMHEAGLAHRNITPTAVFVGDTGAKLADFGMAKFIALGRTVSRMPRPVDVEYVDPDVIRGARPSRASDIWSLGVLLHWEMSDHMQLHPGLAEQSPVDAVRQILSERLTISANLAPDIADAVRWALAPDPVNRPATAEQFAQRLDASVGQHG